MAALQERNGSFRIIFSYRSKQHAFTVGKVSRQEAEAKAAQVDYLLLRLRQRFVELPPGVDVVSFVQHDGKPPQIVTDEGEAVPVRDRVTLGVLRDRYLGTHRGSLEKTPLDGIELHFKHILGTLGEGFPLQELSLAELQRHADRRAKMKGARGSLSPATIKKEFITLRTAWNWAVPMGLVSGRFPPMKMVRLPKPDEKPPFMTREEIERRNAAGGVSEKQAAELWESLYLTVAEIDEFLLYVREHATADWVYPMVCFAAHTGARRSEMLRALATDIDFAGGTVLIREKKRVHSKRTTRRVPLTPFLAGVLKGWLSSGHHPGGQFLFCHPAEVARSKSRSRTTGHKGEKTRAKTKKGRAAGVRLREAIGIGPVTPDEAHDHLKRTVSGEKWGVLRGYHTLRHSFISACASKGVDQRLIQAWCGRMTAEMQRRYTHLYPTTQQKAIETVFERK